MELRQQHTKKTWSRVSNCISFWRSRK